MQQDYKYTGWDATTATGCICDEGFTSYDCGQRQCILGNDPYYGGQQEIQTIRTTVDHQYEMQRITLGGADVNQVCDSIIFDRLINLLCQSIHENVSGSTCYGQ
jgi:hypothetical protein